MTKVVYYSHPMELDGQGLLNDSGKRAFESRRLLSEAFEVWVPEEHQAENHNIQEKIDLDALITSDILLVDFYHFGLVVNNALVLGKGTNQEIGFVKALNKIRAKKVPIIQIVRQSKNFHCFDRDGQWQDYGVTINVNSLAEACEYIEKEYGNA